MMRTLPEPTYLNRALETAKHKRLVTLSNGDTFWLISQRPFEEAATGMLRSALRATAAPTVLTQQHPT